MTDRGAGGTGATRRRFLDANPTMAERFGDPFRPLEPDCAVMQFSQPLSDAQLQRAGELMAGRPEVELYVYGQASRKLDFLAHFPTLQRLHVALYQLDDLSGLAQLRGGLRKLTFGPTKKKFSLRFLETLPRLDRLFLAGHKKDIASIEKLRALRSLGLSGITLPDLNLLAPLGELRAVSIFLGSMTNFGALAQLPVLEELFLMRITGLSDLGVLRDLRQLRTLRLDWMRNVTALPSLAGLARLESVTLNTMKGLTDLSPVAAAPALRRLAVDAMPQLTADSFRCLLDHPALTELRVHTGKQRVSAEIKRMFPQIAR